MICIPFAFYATIDKYLQFLHGQMRRWYGSEMSKLMLVDMLKGVNVLVHYWCGQ